MKHSPAKVIAELLQQGSSPLFSSYEVGTIWPIFVAHMPDKPNDCGTIYDTPGILEGRIYDSGKYVKQFGLQIRFRATDHNRGWEKAYATAAFLSTILNVSVVVGHSNTYQINTITQSSTILPLGVEKGEGRRMLFTLNCLVRMEEG